jgi:site-specific recombinase
MLMVFKKKKKPGPVTVFLENRRSISIKDREAALSYLISFINLVRPPRRRSHEADHLLTEAIRLMMQNPEVLTNLRMAVVAQLINSNLVPMLTESGLTISRGAGRELYARLKHKFIPALQDHNDFLYLLNRIFYKRNDYVWVQTVSREHWIRFFELLGLSLSGNEPVIMQQALLSMQILSARISQLGWENEIVRNAPNRLSRTENPFAVQQYLVHELVRNSNGDRDTIRKIATNINRYIEEGLQLVRYIRENTPEKGTSLSQTFILFQIEQKLARMLLLLDIVDADDRINIARFADLFITVIRNENRKNSLGEFLSKTTGYLAYQIAEHKGKKGNKYITSSPREYWQMIGSAMWGGFIICWVAIVKNVLALVHMAPFWQAFSYSINYSIGFVMIEETKSTLATKQPAFTASAVASSLDTRKADDKPNLYNLAVTVSKVSRSQIASFIGNLIVVFPGTYLLAWLYDITFGQPLASGEQAVYLLKSQHPAQSLSLLYACNTGFFLFLSGIIAGYVQNKINYGRIGKRLTDHPLLHMYFSTKRLQKIANYLEKSGGGLAGNIALGFFLGMAALAGQLFGIPFDIRHITISAANTSIGLYGIGWEHVNKNYLLVVFIGVIGIGFLNFLVSFSLAFIVAVRSRGVKLRDYLEFIGILWKFFRSHPLDFIRPRKRINTQVEKEP